MTRASRAGVPPAASQWSAHAVVPPHRCGKRQSRARRFCDYWCWRSACVWWGRERASEQASERRVAHLAIGRSPDRRESVVHHNRLVARGLVGWLGLHEVAGPRAAQQQTERPDPRQQRCHAPEVVRRIGTGHTPARSKGAHRREGLPSCLYLSRWPLVLQSKCIKITKGVHSK